MKVLSLLLSHFFIILFFVTSLSAKCQQLVGKVIGVKDGDTIELLYHGKPVTIRLEHIDAPEKNQDFGAASKKFVSDFCFGKDVIIIGNGKKDRNGRMIAEVFYGNLNLGKELIRQGLAWHYKKYSGSEVYAALEIKARKRKIGIWKNNDAIAPWLWRNKKKPRKLLPAA